MIPPSHQPHDKFFKVSVKEKAIVESFLKAHLPATTYQRLDLTTLALTEKSLSLPGLQEMHCDLVYSCQIDGHAGYVPILFLFEHLAYTPKYLPLYLLQGSLGLMIEHIRTGGDQLPIVIPLGLYHGKESPYPHSTDIFDYFGDPELARAVMFKPFTLVDLTTMPVEEILHHGMAAPMELFFKEYRSKNFLQALKQAIDTRLLQDTVLHTTASYFGTMIEYILMTGDQFQPVDSIIQLLNETFPERKETIMNFAQQLEQRGVQKGLQSRHAGELPRSVANR